MFGIIFWIIMAFILYVYAGYPLLVALLAQLRRLKEVEAARQPTVTLIFAAYNEEKIIARKLENSLSLDYPKELLQILAADDGSTDQTAEIIRTFESKGIELVSSKERRGKLAAIKEAVRQACGEVLLFSDADALYPPDCLNEVVKPFADESVGAVSGGRNVSGDTSLGNAEGLYWKYEEFIKRQESKLGSCTGVAGDLLAIRKCLYTPPPDGTINDDFYMALAVLKQGKRVVHASKARSYHPIGANEAEEAERRARMVAGRYQVLFGNWRMLPFRNPLAVWQIFSHKFFRPLVPMAMALGFIASLLALAPVLHPSGPAWLVLATPFNWIIFGLQAVFYLAALFSMKYTFKGWIGKALYIPAFLVNSNLAALVGLYRYITSTQSVSWRKATR